MQYLRNTLADSARVEIPVDKTVNSKDVLIDFQRGYISAAVATKLMEAAETKLKENKGRQNKKEESWENLEEIQVLIAPFRISPLPEYAQFTGETGIFYPFWIRAVLNNAGTLKPDEDTFPYIPRTYLEPQINQDINFTFSDVNKIDDAFSKPIEGTYSWKEYWDYIQETFTAITAERLENYTIANFTVTYQNTIVVNETLTSAADGIIKLYDFLIQKQKISGLLANLCNTQYEPLKSLLTIDDFETASAKHVGQMGYEYALSISQRKSLYHFNELTEGSVLAVNGPPGTGKTTLLQSIVANEVVKSALNGKDPAIILACSTNNQAVTNIIDSFSNVKQKNGTLYERWLPNLSGFGLYLPSSKKIVGDQIPTIKRESGRLTGAHLDMENRAYISTAENHFRNRFERYTGRKGLSVKEIVADLQSIVKKQKQELEEGVRIWQQYKNIIKLVDELDPGQLSSRLFEHQVLDEGQLKNIETSIQSIEEKLADYLDKESFWIKLFSFLNPIKEKRATRIKQLYRDCLVGYKMVNFYEIKSLHHFFDEKLRVIGQMRELNSAWHTWKSANQVKGNPPLTDTDFKTAEQNRASFFYDELEKGIKYDLFYLAIHYWEGRWLIETNQVLDEERVTKNGMEDVKNRWRRFSMLTPCFVSTFYMAPKFFTYSLFIKKTFSGNVFETPPLLEFIDLLIVDEAGQVSPEIGAASFALAKRSVVVGDTLQIEPVWNVPKKVDYANLIRHEVIRTIDDQKTIEDLLIKGFLSSSGSVMKLAQKTSEYHLYPQTERGMLLIEHRRCFDEIIGYCNKLAYNGLLEPKRGPAKNILFPPMQFVEVAGESKSIGSSRGNQEEAAQITAWVQHNKERILLHYQQTENAEALKGKRPVKKLHIADIIGIITPFTGQKFILKSALQTSGIDISGLTIGTVHALQGAERSIILFSSTYGKNDVNKSYFFDSGVNMLNVAVSRAKDTFIFFGSKNNFDKIGNTPSIQLYKYIKNTERKSV